MRRIKKKKSLTKKKLCDKREKNEDEEKKLRRKTQSFKYTLMYVIFGNYLLGLVKQISFSLNS